MDLNEKIYIAGHNGLVGSALIRELKKRGFSKFSGNNKPTIREQNKVNKITGWNNLDISYFPYFLAFGQWDYWREWR